VAALIVPVLESDGILFKQNKYCCFLSICIKQVPDFSEISIHITETIALPVITGSQGLFFCFDSLWQITAILSILQTFSCTDKKQA